MRLIEEIMNEICEVMDKFDEDTLDQTMTLLSKDKKIFVDGEGRSGFVGRCFAMRLMHIGYQPYVMGETITPALRENEVYLAISGSGTTKNTLSNAKAAKKLGLKIIAVTSKRRIGTWTISRLHHQGSRKSQRRSKNGFHSTA